MISLHALLISCLCLLRTPSINDNRKKAGGKKKQCRVAEITAAPEVAISAVIEEVQKTDEAPHVRMINIAAYCELMLLSYCLNFNGKSPLVVFNSMGQTGFYKLSPASIWNKIG